MKNTTVLISGASIAGPALAFWLARYGCTVTVVERAPGLRSGGQAVDFKGETHRTVLAHMGILDDIRALQTGGQDQTIVDAAGRPLAVIPGEFTGGEIEIRRGELSRLLYERTAGDCEYRFGDTVTSLTDTPGGVHVTFANAAPRTFDLVIGADGIHSNVRRLAFGPEGDFVRHLGHYYALVELGADGDPVMYNEPGRMVALGGPKAPAFFVFASPQLQYDRYDPQAQKDILRRAYRGAKWRVPELLARLDDATDVYLDSISRAEVPAYARGRVALLGDAAYGNTLGGFGTGLAVVGAYVLAGELRAAGGEHRTAFARYESLFRGYASISRKGSAGPFLAPGNRARMAMRNWMFRSPWMLRQLLKATDKFATSIDLPQYP
ncbi:FAD-dependent monooxygenase [Dactylosporangium sp. NPDC051485]|uniref:FAD-dependent monooxygenase n=1 Tax=Dactylosporangium sp. NPDC051485 TaxID=3154846 RepID=UPI0034275581